MGEVAFRNVDKQFADGTVALKDFDLHVDDGELVVLVGPSGCGKSTALRLLAGLEAVSSGEIQIGGRVVNQLSPQQRNVAMVFQNYALYPHMSVRGNLAFPLRMNKTPKAQIAAKVTEIAGMLNLEELLDRKPAQLSGGQRQRVAMGRALVRNPSVFLLDEPLSNLDAELRTRIRTDIAELQKRLQKTTLYVTHDQVEAMTLGDRVAVMERGKLHQVGTPAELYQQPQSLFVAKFIGNPGMNVFTSTLWLEGDERWRVRVGTTDIPLPQEQLPTRHSLQQDMAVTVGFRPEAVAISPTDHTVSCRVRVTATEFLGHETLVHFHFAESENQPSMVARIPGQCTLPADSVTDLFINPEALYLFGEEGILLLE